MVDTVRSLGELLALFASNQAPRSITEQDVRDAIVSLSLETGNFADLPRALSGLDVGRCWIDSNLALRVVTVITPPGTMNVSAVLGGAGGLSAFPLLRGQQLASWQQGGVGSFIASSSSYRRSGSANLGASGILVPPAPLKFPPSPTLTGRATIVATVVQRMRVSASLSGAATLTADPQRAAPLATWDPARKSTYITLSNNNLTATKTANDGWYGGVVASSFKSAGKWYWEFSIGAKVGDTGVGLANPSWPVDNGDLAFGSYLGLPGATTSIGLYNGGSAGYTNNGDGTGGVTPMPNVVANGNVGFALDCVNWKWWARQNGGLWNVGQVGAQDPATNQGGIPIGVSYRTGGVAPAITLQSLNDVVIGRFASASWSFVAPTGFVGP
jgi:hypothetical protein